jgi:hypothetical protein
LAERLQQEETGLNMTREWDKLGMACLTWLDLGEADLEAIRQEAEVFLSQAVNL